MQAYAVLLDSATKSTRADALDVTCWQRQAALHPALVHGEAGIVAVSYRYNTAQHLPDRTKSVTHTEAEEERTEWVRCDYIRSVQHHGGCLRLTIQSTGQMVMVSPHDLSE